MTLYEFHRADMFSSFQSWTCFHSNNTPKKGLRNSFLGSFFVRTPGQSPRQSSHFFSFGGIGTVRTIAEKSRKTRFSPANSPLLLSQLLVLHSPRHPHKNPSQNRRGRLVIPACFWENKHDFCQITEQHSQLDVCPLKGKKWGGCGGCAWGEKEVKIIRTLCAFFVKRWHSISV